MRRPQRTGIRANGTSLAMGGAAVAMGFLPTSLDTIGSLPMAARADFNKSLRSTISSPAPLPFSLTCCYYIDT